jgi:L-amino acid N-acyltransferase YncA
MIASPKAVTLITTPSPQQLEAAAALVDAGGQRKRPVKRHRFRKARTVVLVLNDRGQVVGVTAVKKSESNVAEVGDAVLLPDYRPYGTAKRAFQILLQEVRKQGIDVLYAKVRPTNVAPIALLKRARFQFWGNYVKTNTVFSWLYLPLSPEVNAEEIMQQYTADLTPVD